jgi:hypothetical protein
METNTRRGWPAAGSWWDVDTVFRTGSHTLCRQVTSIAERVQGSFKREVAHAAEQIGYGVEFLVQGPQGQMLCAFRGSGAAVLTRHSSGNIEPFI